ncbi:MAG: methyltransferase domain-containing protein [Deltaproteobacteria bacterium]|nr:methyltransferase domain-containing protein [Deltaproteobacteria bacterium]
MIHSNINCKACIEYNTCKNLDEKYRDRLDGAGGDWRRLKNNGISMTSPIRRCSLAIFDSHKDTFKNNRVLEIGCGANSEVDVHFCKENNVDYLGIDPGNLPPLYIPGIKGRKLQNRIAIFFLNLFGIKKIFHNKHQHYISGAFPSPYLEGMTFDLIYGNNSIEHWHENEEDILKSIDLYRNDLNYCYDLLAEGGKLILSAPVHLHGNKIFLLGKLEVLDNFFDSRWKSVVIEHWRESHDDLLPYCPDQWKNWFINELNIHEGNIFLVNIIAQK